jgi:EmrB/QacA subfamily drug resistance transporter
MSAPQQPELKLRYNPWLVLVTLCLGFFMILLDTTIVNVAIPQLSDGLNAQLSDILWILNAYILTYAVLLITAGRLGDLYGPKLLFMSGLVVFTAASAACGFAQNPTQLIVFRIIQGVGGAMLTPQTLSVITMIFPAERRGAAFGLWGAVAGVSTIAGPVLGGWLVTDFSWRWIFFVNVPIGAVALVMAGILMPNIQLNRRHKLDVGGVALSTAGLFLLCYGLIEGPSYSWGKVWGPISIPLILLVGAALLGLFMWLQWAERAGEPLVPFSIFADRNYSIMNFVVAAISFGMLGLFLPLTIFLQSVLGLSALQAGLVTAPMSLISMVVAPIAGRASDRLGGKWVVFAGVSLFAAGMGIVVASVHLGMSRWHFLPGLIVAGFGLGMTFAPLQTVAMRNVQPRMAGAASGFINTTRQLGGVIGSAAVGALLQSQLKVALADSAQKNVATMPANVPQQIKDGLVSAFSHVSGDLEIGAGKTGIDPKQIPEQFRAVVGATAKKIFDEGFTDAMRHTLWLPIAVMGLAAVSILFVRRDHGGPLTPAPAPAAEKTEVPAQQAR